MIVPLHVTRRKAASTEHLKSMILQIVTTQKLSEEVIIFEWHFLMMYERIYQAIVMEHPQVAM